MSESFALVDAAFAAALNPELWDSWMNSMIASLGAISGSFAVVNRETQSVLRMDVYGAGLNLIGGYRSYWRRFDPQLPRALAVSSPETYVDHSFVEHGGDQIAAYMDWQRAEAGIGYSLTGAIPLPESTLLAVLVYHRSATAGYVAPKEHRKLSSMMGGLRNAFDLGFTQNRYLQDAMWEGLTFENPEEAAFLLGERGKILRLNGQAELILQKRDGVLASSGRLAALTEEATRSLSTLIARTASNDGGPREAIRLPRGNGRTDLIVVCYPLRQLSRPLAASQAVMLVRIIDPSARPTSARNVYQQAFRLSAREADLAENLLQGHSLESAASVLAITTETARVHLRRLFQKTEVNRQSDLMRLLSKLR